MKDDLVPIYNGIMLHILRPLPVASLKLLVFDLDGTLIDSAQDLCNSVNATLARFGREPLPDERIASFIGNGTMSTSWTSPTPTRGLSRRWPRSSSCTTRPADRQEPWQC